jgi:hypothetical protein
MGSIFISRPSIVAAFAWFGLLLVSHQAFPADPSTTLDDGQRSNGADASAAADSTKYDLRYKLSTGDIVRFEVSHRASIRSTIDETTQAAQTKTDSVKLWKVTDVLPNGEIEFINVVERVHMVNQLPDRDPTEYDSVRDETPPPGFEDAAKSVGVPLSVVRMTPRGKIVERQAKFRHLDVSDDAPLVVRLPEKPVSIGETWDEEFNIQVELPNGKSKSLKTRRHHKLTQVENNTATIDVAYQILSPVDPVEEAQLIERLMKGQVQFNLATGRITGQQMEIDKKILGFAGPTSSLQYLMKMEEKAVAAPKKKVVGKPGGKAPRRATATASAKPPGSPSAGNARRPPQRATNPPRSSRQPAKGYSR